MDEITTGELAAIIALTVGIWAVLIAVGFKRIKQILGVVNQRPVNRLVELEVLAERPFELEYVIKHKVPHRLFLEYRMRAPRTGGGEGTTGSLAGIAIRLEIFEDGKPVGKTVVGRGEDMPCKVDYMRGVAFFTVHSREGSELSSRGTMPVIDLRPRKIGTKITIKGEVLPNIHTHTSRLTFFLSF